MKKTGLISLIITLLITSCNDDEFYSDIKNGGVWMKMGDGMIVGTSDIDYYDASTYKFYLKRDLPYLKKIEQGGSLSVFVDNTEIYKCTFYPSFSSAYPTGVYISSSPLFYPEFLLSIETNIIPDPRNDDRIIEALKKYDQYHEGLFFEIQSVSKSNGKVIMNAELYNPDIFDYYYLDPDKMGMGLFHYFTNGLSFYDSNNNSYTNQETVTRPEPWNSWNKEWLSLIKSGERKKISLVYNNFEKMLPGNYRASFSFPGLTNQIKQKELLQQDSGRIWLGQLFVTKDVVID